MSATSIGAQLYTIRDHTKTEQDFADSCQKLREMGFSAVQLSAVGPIDVERIGQILRDNGLACAATHVALDMMKDTQRCLDYHRTLDCSYTAIGGFHGETRDQWLAFADDFSEVAKALGAEGLKVGYHNHSHELAVPDGGGATVLDLLVENCDPAVAFEIDTYWIAHGGGDPAAWLDKVAASAPGRLDAIHVKDMAITRDREQYYTEVGAGNLNWPAIMAAARRAGVRWYLIERDDGEVDPFESLRISLTNLRKMGLS